MSSRTVHAAALLAAIGFAAGVAADVLETTYSRIELIAEQASVPATGGRMTLGFHLEPSRGWHAYWQNPGDAGKEPSIDWALPDGFTVEPLQFPTPHLIPFGDFNTYGYEGAILLLADVDVPDGLEPGTAVRISGQAGWVVCDDALCVPEDADIELTMLVGDGGVDVEAAHRFSAARDALPEPADWPARFALVGEDIAFDASLPAGAGPPAELFVAPKRFVRYGEQAIARTTGGVRFTMAAGRRAADFDAVDAVLRYRNADGDDASAWLTFAKADGPLPAVAAPSGTVSAAASAGEVVRAIVFGLLGGILLNLMPCVFPILSLKALGLADLSKAGAKAARESGLLYTAGVLATFLVIAVLLIVLRQAGEAVGWGFQLQSPWVLVVLGLAMVAIGLNLAGVFEIGTRAMGLGQGLTASNERRAAFFTGALAVVVATPCTAPFMAGALGFALVQPVPVALAVFMALGFGLALPYLALTLLPALGRVMPRPGPWMATFRHVLAFPMLATALWLFWVIGRQLGATAMAVALLAALFLGFALWAYGRSAAGGRTVVWRTAAVAGLVACIAAGANLGDRSTTTSAAGVPGSTTHRLGKLEPEAFTPDRVVGYVESDTPVFVYFTADWCISCKVNERIALATDEVGDAFNDRGIKVIEGDWTTEDPVITEWLARYDRAGVPLYLYFPAGSSLAEAAVLPQVLLPGVVIDAITAADTAVADAAMG